MEDDNGIFCPGCGDDLADDGECYVCDYNPRDDGEEIEETSPEEWDCAHKWRDHNA